MIKVFIRMGKEIERKFLVKNSEYKTSSDEALYKQGYLCINPNRTVRVRVVGDKGLITVKGKSTGASRLEFEYEIPFEDANEMLDILCEKPIIEKIRYTYDYAGFIWEIDEFLGDNEGLVVAEIELQDESMEFSKPIWIGEEVTGDPKYYNSSLIKNPYKNW